MRSPHVRASGAGALIFAANRDGRLRGDRHRYLDTRLLEHPSLSAEVCTALKRDTHMKASDWHDDILAREIDAANLIDPPPDAPARLGDDRPRVRVASAAAHRRRTWAMN
jgi:hypothetical protein